MRPNKYLQQIQADMDKVSGADLSRASGLDSKTLWRVRNNKRDPKIGTLTTIWDALRALGVKEGK